MILSLHGLKRIRIEYPEARVVLASGTFDILHRGHLDYLKWARSNGDVLLVGVSNDQTVKARKGPSRPVNSEADRLYLLDALKTVDYCVLVDKYYGIMEEISTFFVPDIFAVYNDWIPENINKLRGAFPEAVVLIDEQGKANSTTAIINKLSQK